MWNDETFSVLVSRRLDHLGYGLPMVQFRQKYIEHKGQREFNMGYSFYAGSKAEGLTKPLESDTDVLSAVLSVICTINPQSLPCSEYLSVFKLDTEDTAAGYTRLILVKLGNPVLNMLLESLCESVHGKVYLSSNSWRQEAQKYLSHEITNKYGFSRSLPIQGPSTPLQSIRGDFDEVLGITCDYPELLNCWIDRPRKYNWPHENIIREIATMEAHVVPVGYKTSPSQFLEWRFCFTKAEIKLIQSFNDCQIKLLILLKWLAKNCLKPICKDMTTYVIKNLVLWMAEQLPGHYFKENNLANILNISIKTLKYCVLKRCLQNYMIPTRNLFADRISDRERSRLCLRIDSLLREGPMLVVRCGKIRDAFNMLQKSPDAFFSFTQRQFRVNLSFILMECAKSSFRKGFITKQYFIEYFLKLCYIVYYAILPESSELSFHRINDLQYKVIKRGLNNFCHRI